MHWHIAKNVLTRKRCIYSSFTHAFIRSLSISNFPSIRYYRVAVLRLHCIRRICERERYFIHIMCWLSGYKFSSSESFDRTCVWVSHNSISTLQFGNFFYRTKCVWIRYTREYMNGISYHYQCWVHRIDTVSLVFPASRFTTSRRNFSSSFALFWYFHFHQFQIFAAATVTWIFQILHKTNTQVIINMIKIV